MDKGWEILIEPSGVLTALLLATGVGFIFEVKADKELCDLFVEASKEINVPCKKGWVPPMGGACDSAAFTQAGYRAAGITGLNHKIERYYHTRLDSYDYMNKEGLGNCFAASVKVLQSKGR